MAALDRIKNEFLLRAHHREAGHRCFDRTPPPPAPTWSRSPTSKPPATGSREASTTRPARRSRSRNSSARTSTSSSIPAADRLLQGARRAERAASSRPSALPGSLPRPRAITPKASPITPNARHPATSSCRSSPADQGHQLPAIRRQRRAARRRPDGSARARRRDRRRDAHVHSPFDNADVIAGRARWARDSRAAAGRRRDRRAGRRRRPDRGNWHRSQGESTGGSIVGVEPDRAACLTEALAQDSPSTVTLSHTLADGLAVGRLGDAPFDIVKRVVDRVVTVDEASIALAILRLIELEKSVVEGAGAAPLAAFLEGGSTLKGKRVVLVLAGGNIDSSALGRIIDVGLVADGRLCRFTVTISDSTQAPWRGSRRSSRQPARRSRRSSTIAPSPARTCPRCASCASRRPPGTSTCSACIESCRTRDSRSMWMVS